MLILVGVTVTVSLNGGLFDKARNAAKETNKEKAIEELNIITADFNADLYANPEKYYKEYAETYEEDDEEETYTIRYADLGVLLKEVKTRILGANQQNPNSSVDMQQLDYLIDGINEKPEANLYIAGIIYEIFNPYGYVTLNENDRSILMSVPFTYKGVSANWNIKLIIDEEENYIYIKEIEYIELILNNDTIITVEEKDTPKVTTSEWITSVTEEGVPIPKGFYYVTGTKNTGVVISDSILDENNAEGNNGNQFVWVPVKTKLNLKVSMNTEKTISTVRIQSTKGYDQTFTVNSNGFEQTLEVSEPTLYEVTTTFIDGEVKHKLYEPMGTYGKVSGSMSDLTLAYLYTKEEMNFTCMEDLVYYSLDKARDEADPEDDELAELLASISSGLDYIKMEDDKEAADYTDDISFEKDSIYKYGGFYIGRYEASYYGKVKKGETVYSSATYASALEKANSLYNDESYGVKSSLPSSSAWDCIGKWIVSTGADTYFNTFVWKGKRELQ